jgi:hypothetical protein
MKTKHTVGQWKHSGLTIYAHKVTETQDSRKIIASIDPKRGEPSEENEANAKLIASAPDLLHALEAARKLINQERKDALTVREIIQQAIDKATK